MIGNARSRPGISGVAISASRARIQLRLPCTRVDLAVVRDVPVRVRERPRRERVRGEAAVHQRQRRLDALVAQVDEELAELRRGEHALVDERAARQRREVHRRRRPAISCSQRLRSDEQLAVEVDARRAVGVVDEAVPEARASRCGAVGPIIESSIGTSRQPRTRRPSSATIASIRATRLLGVGRCRAGRNARPTP